MAYCATKNSKDDFDITKEEINQLGEALKKEEFRKLLNGYFQEVNDPKNKALFQKEFTEYERERGVDVKFINPEPGYVIKTSVDGKRKAFINICCNEHVAKPLSSYAFKEGSPGLNWSIPYLQGQPKDDLDNKNEKCSVYDVIFHPDTLYLAKKNIRIKKLVNNIALSAVEDVYNVKLDRKNIVFPKIQYKGYKVATVIRKSRDNYEKKEEDENVNIPGCPYSYPPASVEPMIVTPRYDDDENDNTPYTVPKYIIKHRKEIEMQEFRDAPDARFHSAIPTELVVEIDLPLIKSSEDVNLDIVDKTLSLISKQPAKYKLNINLPYSIDDENGSAKFDKSKKKLIINLPVKMTKFNPSDFCREDSGIESDVNHNNNSSSEEDIRKSVELLHENDPTLEETNANTYPESRTSTEVKTQFLNPEFHYSFPTNALTFEENLLRIKMTVKNIDPQSVAHQFLDENDGVHIKFSSLGSGFFPIHFAYCLKITAVFLDKSSLNIDVWDNCLIATLKVQLNGDKQIIVYSVGTNLDSMIEKNLSLDTEICSSYFKENIPVHNINKNIENLKDKLEDKFNTITKEITSNQTQQDLVENKSKKKLKPRKTITKVEGKAIFKNRTFSETSELSDSLVCGRRSILKCSRSLSESHTDDYNNWSSLDSESHEDLGTSKKTVRFNDVVSKKIFRANSSILGQKKKNEKKSRNRKKAANERRLSAGSEESETEREEFDSVSEFSDLSDVSSDDSSGTSSDAAPAIINIVVPSSKTHRRRGAKNQRKAAATAKHSHYID